MKEKPEECDMCAYVTDNLVHFRAHGIDMQEKWICPYCCLAYSPNENTQLKRTLAGMFNELEKRITAHMAIKEPKRQI